MPDQEIIISPRVTLILKEGHQPLPIKGLAAWIAQLRIQKRAKGYLRYGEAYCCLGVKYLAEGATWAQYGTRWKASVPEQTAKQAERAISHGMYEYLGGCGLEGNGELGPRAVVDISTFEGITRRVRLATVNDSLDGDDFTEIIGIIERCFCEAPSELPLSQEAA